MKNSFHSRNLASFATSISKSPPAVDKHRMTEILVTHGGGVEVHYDDDKTHRYPFLWQHVTMYLAPVVFDKVTVQHVCDDCFSGGSVDNRTAGETKFEAADSNATCYLHARRFFARFR